MVVIIGKGEKEKITQLSSPKCVLFTSFINTVKLVRVMRVGRTGYGGGVIVNRSVLKPEREDACKMSSETVGTLYIL